MSSSYPGGLDSFTNPTASDQLDSTTVPHHVQHANANDAIEAVESTLGVNPQGASASVAARLTGIDTAIANISLTPGPQGPKGDAGTAATIAVGTVTTGAAGSSATVTNAGTSSAAVLNFSIPQGAAGTNGTNGTNGTAATIDVGTVTTGAAGSSATVTNSGTSSAAVFNFSIPQGASGAAGATGATGPSGVIAVTSPITNSGTSTSAQIGIDQSLLTIAQSQVTGLSTSLSTKANTNSANTFTTGTQTVKSGSDTVAPLQVQRNSATASANIAEFTTSTGTVLAKVDAAGNITATSFAGSGASLTSIPESAITNLTTDLAAKANTASPTFTGTVTLPAGAAGSAPLLLTSGTLQTSPAAGSLEYTAPAMFATSGASGRGVLYAPQLVRLDATRTKPTNNTTLEALFAGASLGSSSLTSGALSLVANTLYYFRGWYLISTSASGTNAGVTVGFTFSNTQQSIQYRSLGYQQSSTTTQTSIYATVVTATTVTASGTAATPYVVELEGWFKTNATTGGTITPTFAQSVAGTSTAPTAAAGTAFWCQPVQTVGVNVGFGAWS